MEYDMDDIQTIPKDDPKKLEMVFNMKNEAAQDQQKKFQAMRHRYGAPQHGTRAETPAMTAIHLLVRRICMHLAQGGRL
jgi:hypothetical protein